MRKVSSSIDQKGNEGTQRWKSGTGRRFPRALLDRIPEEKASVADETTNSVLSSSQQRGCICDIALGLFEEVQVGKEPSLEGGWEQKSPQYGGKASPMSGEETRSPM